MFAKMSQEPTQVELIHQSIQLVQKLRFGVGQVFKDLSDGISEYVEEPQNKEEGEQTTTSGTDRTDEQSQSEKHKAILRNLKKSLQNISHDLSDLEKTGSNIGHVQSFSNIDNLCMDPVDKTAFLHSQLLQSYRWTNKMHEHAQHAVSILSQNPLKRTQTPRFTSAKKPRGSLPLACVVSPNVVDQFIETLDKDQPDMSISIDRPFGSCGIMQIELGRTLRAIIVLRGLMIEWVKVKGYDESFRTEDGQIDVWSSSRYQVFQKITNHAEAASLHYYAPAMPELAIKSFVVWFQGFSTLFSAPCQKCGKHLQNNMPPTWRDFRTKEPFHDVCRM